MKNSQKGFIVPLLSAIIAILIVGGGGYFYTQNKNLQKQIDQNKMITDSVVSTTTITQTTTTTTSNVPVINSLSSNQGKVGDTIIIYGNNFSTNLVRLTNQDGAYGVQPITASSGGTQLQFAIPDMISGNYQIGVFAPGTSAWGAESNRLNFTVTSNIPVINSLSSNKGVSGEAISIYGSNFIIPSISNGKTVSPRVQFIKGGQIIFTINLNGIGEYPFTSSQVRFQVPNAKDTLDLESVKKVPGIYQIHIENWDGSAWIPSNPVDFTITGSAAG